MLFRNSCQTLNANLNIPAFEKLVASKKLCKCHYKNIPQNSLNLETHAAGKFHQRKNFIACCFESYKHKSI